MRARKWLRTNERGIFWAGVVALLCLISAGAALLAYDGLTELEAIGVVGAVIILFLFVVARLRGTGVAATVQPVEAVEDGPTESIASPRRRFQHLQWPATGRAIVRPQIPAQPARRHLAAVADNTEDNELFKRLFDAAKEPTDGYPPVTQWGEEAT